MNLPTGTVIQEMKQAAAITIPEEEMIGDNQ
jgi:hypothetical protein